MLAITASTVTSAYCLPDRKQEQEHANRQYTERRYRLGLSERDDSEGQLSERGSNLERVRLTRRLGLFATKNRVTLHAV
jgi:hypothetical protein